MLSLGILLLKYVFEKPNLKTTVEKVYYTQPESTYNFTTFYISLRFENVGRRNTTVHSVELSFTYKDENYSPQLLEGQVEVMVISDDVKRKHVNFGLQKHQYVIPEGDIYNATLKITHTHDKETITIPVIKQS